jgi:hypothetical protein
MWLSNRLVLPVMVSALAVLAGCSSSSSNTATPPPGGKFSSSNLNGSYAFSAIGTDAVGAPFSLAGNLQANGGGRITGGTLDLNDASLAAPLLAVAITGGSYTVTADGRGQATLNAGQAPVVLDFVLLSNSHALVTRYDGTGTGSGSMDLQSAVTQAQLADSYAFTLGGIDAHGNPFATEGAFTLDSVGNISSGVEDFNDGGLAYPGLTLSGSVTVGMGGAPGTATLTATNSSSAAPFGTLTFDVYAVDATQLKFVEKDTLALLGGDAFTQRGASLPSTSTVLVFTMAGGVNAPLSVGGLMTIDGVSAVSNGSEDINENGSTPSAPLSFSGSYTASGAIGGRTLFTLTGFTGATEFVAYPTANAGVQLLELDNGGLLGGAAFAQTAGATLASSQGYGLGLAAVNIGGISGSFEEDDVAEFSTTSSGFSGLIDINDEGTLTFDQTFNGSLTLDSPATGRGVLTSNIFNGVFYAVDSSNVLLLETDTTQVGTGSLQLQTPGAKSNLAARRMTVLHLAPAAGKAWRSK